MALQSAGKREGLLAAVAVGETRMGGVAFAKGVGAREQVGIHISAERLTPGSVNSLVVSLHPFTRPKSCVQK